MQNQFFELRWTADRLEKIARGHGVSPEEVEEAFFNDAQGKLMKTRGGRYLYLGANRCWSSGIGCARRRGWTRCWAHLRPPADQEREECTF
jgi:hypothetical protein